MLLLAGCTLRSEDASIDLPDPAPAWFAECYLHPNQPATLTLSPVTSYFSLPDTAQALGWFQTLATRTQVRFVMRDETGALISEEPLRYVLPDSSYPLGRFVGENPTGEDDRLSYSLFIDLPEQQMQGETRMLPPITLKEDDLNLIWDTRDSAGIAIRLAWSDPDLTQENFYRVIINDFRPDSIANFEYRDRQFNGSARPFFLTGFGFQPGDSVELTVYNVSKAYYDFIQTAEQAASAADNPFTEPALIQSTLTGGLGVFEGLHPGRPLRFRLPKRGGG